MEEGQPELASPSKPTCSPPLPLRCSPRAPPPIFSFSHPLTGGPDLTSPMTSALLPQIARPARMAVITSPSSLRAFKAPIPFLVYAYKYPSPPSLICPKNHSSGATMLLELIPGPPPLPPAKTTVSGDLRRPSTVPLLPFFLSCTCAYF